MIPQTLKTGRFWASQSDAEQGGAAIRPQLMEVFGAAMDGPPERSMGEVQYADPPVTPVSLLLDPPSPA